MKLSTKSKYGLRACCALAAADGRPVSASTLEKEIAVSGKYLEKIMRMLASRGIVAASRGQSGGYYLTRPPAEVGVGEIVRALEDDMEIASCASGGGCSSCAGGLVWRRVYESINAALDAMTLGSLLKEFADKKEERKEDGKENLSGSCGDHCARSESAR